MFSIFSSNLNLKIFFFFFIFFPYTQISVSPQVTLKMVNKNPIGMDNLNKNIDGYHASLSTVKTKSLSSIGQPASSTMVVNEKASILIECHVLANPTMIDIQLLHNSAIIHRNKHFGKSKISFPFIIPIIFWSLTIVPINASNVFIHYIIWLWLSLIFNSSQENVPENFFFGNKFNGNVWYDISKHIQE